MSIGLRYTVLMKTYINTILVSSVFLLLFPFLGFGEIIEYFYVIILGTVIGLSALFLRHKSGLVEEIDEATSLEDYVKELQERFKQHTSSSMRNSPSTNSHARSIKENLGNPVVIDSEDKDLEETLHHG